MSYILVIVSIVNMGIGNQKVTVETPVNSKEECLRIIEEFKSPEISKNFKGLNPVFSCVAKEAKA